jgi:hypothetical protein
LWPRSAEKAIESVVNGKKPRAGAEKIRGVEIFGLWTTEK